jgi:hypothetical protein
MLVQIKNWSRHLVIFLLSVWLVALIMLPSNPFKALPGRDNGVFLYGGQQVLLGGIPYVDFWDHKGPLIYYINALGLLLGKGSRWGVWGLEFGFMVLTSLGLYQVARNQWGYFSGFIALGFWAYCMSRNGPYDFHGSNFTETYSSFFNVLAVLFWVMADKPSWNRWLFVLAGVMGGSSFFLRPNNIGAETAIVAVEIVKAVRLRSLKEGIENLVFLMIGTLGILTLFSLLLLNMGAFPGFIDAVFTYNIIYTQTGYMSFYKFLLEGFTGLVWLPVLLYLVLAVYFIRNEILVKSKTPGSNFALFLLIGWPLEIILTAISGRIYPHYFITWVPYFGWLTASVAITVPPLVKDKFERLSVVFLPALLLILTIVGNFPTIGYFFKLANRLVFDRERHIEATSPIVRYVTINTEPGDYILVWGNDVWINFLADRKSPSKYAYQYPLFMPGYTDGEKVAAFLRDLQSNPPKLIIEIKEEDYHEIISLSTLMERKIIISRDGLPAKLGEVIDYINGNYCVRVSLREAVVYQLISESTPENPCH